MMRSDYSAFLILAPFMAIAVLGATYFVWRKRRSPGARYLLLFAVSAFAYLVFNSLELISSSREWTLFWAKGEHIWSAAIPVFWVLFVFDITGHTDWIRPTLIIPLVGPGVVDIVLVYLNDLHHLIWKSVEFFPVGNSLGLRVDHGPYFFVASTYEFALLIVGLFFIQRDLRTSHGLYRRQLLWIAGGIIIPVLFSLIYVFHLIPWLHKDYSPLGFAIGALLFIGAVARSRFLDITPASRSKIFDALADGVVVLDSGYRIIDINTQAMAVLSLDEMALGTVLGSNRDIAMLIESLTDELETVSSDIATGEGDGRRYYELRLNRISADTNGRNGYLILLHDITERTQLLEEIKTLRGIVPICAHCKKIRDDDGFWQHVEEYVSAHSYAEFSHGLCPDCLEKLYPEQNHDAGGSIAGS